MISIKSLMALIITALLTSLPNKAISIKNIALFEEIRVPPIRKTLTGPNTTITAKALITSKVSNRYVQVSVSNGNGLSEILHKEVFKSGVSVKTFSFEYTEFYGTNVFFTFEIIEDKVITKTVTIVPSYIAQASFEIPTSMTISTASSVKVYKSSKLTDKFEKIKMRGFDGLYGKEYGCFDLSTYRVESFLEDEYADASYGKCGVFLYDNNGYFSSVGSQIQNVTHIPFVLIKEDTGRYHFELANQIYIDPETLLMSNTYVEGYIPTKRYIYLPKNSKDKIKDSSMKFYVDDLGINLITVTHTFSLNGINNDFGYCQTSKYCVEQSPSEFDESKGKIINND